MDWEFDGEIIEWRGPAPFLFVDLDPELSADVKAAAKGLEYWGQVAVEAEIGDTRFTTALFPKDGRYLLPVKVAVRRAEQVDEGDVVPVRMTLRLPR
ncbi:MAG TPA: DUF1905 domain-containing protein [Candidatus Ruania gallistercoris]|uniref:DUF1905 domain-containing protein n=1 Tax=Candidatus Ruania gallistercoris TaxID=2838746 RepID=A0A9D2EEG1_9MICO|nr:DUF1905 domain-containing protein [Candidatus Ruania gallistercoris]